MKTFVFALMMLVLVGMVSAYQVYYFEDGRWGSNLTSSVYQAPSSKWICYPQFQDFLSRNWTCPQYSFTEGGQPVVQYDGTGVPGGGMNDYMISSVNYTGFVGKRLSFDIYGGPGNPSIGYVGFHNGVVSSSTFLCDGQEWCAQWYVYGSSNVSLMVNNGTSTVSIDSGAYIWNWVHFDVEVNSTNDGIMIKMNGQVKYQGPYVGVANDTRLHVQHYTCCGNSNMWRMDNIVVTDQISEGSCYQETASEANFCGGLSSGSYLSVPVGYFEKAIDGVHRQYNVSTTWCYQESANVSNQAGTDGSCGLSYSGSYTEARDFGIFPWPQNRYILINYTKPENATSTSVWMVKRGTQSITNYSIPFACWSAYVDKLILVEESLISGNGGNSQTTLYCYNGTGYFDMGSYYSGYNMPPPVTGSAGPDFAFDGNWSTFVTDLSWHPLYEWQNSGQSPWTNTSASWNGLPINTTLLESVLWEEGMWWSIASPGISAVYQNDSSKVLYINYSKPATAVDAYWMIDGGLQESNLTCGSNCVDRLPSSGILNTKVRLQDACWNAYLDKVVLKVDNYPGGVDSDFQYWCNNGTSWEGVMPRAPGMNGQLSSQGWVWDEGINWTMCAANWVCLQWGECTLGNERPCVIYNDTACGLTHTAYDQILTQECAADEGTGMMKSSSFIQLETYGPMSIATQELSGDGTSSIVSATGVYGYNRQIAAFPDPPDTTAVVAVDAAGTSYTSVISVSSAVLSSVVSTPPVNPILTGNLSVQDIKCAYDIENNLITATVVGVSAPKKDWVQFSAKYSVYPNGLSGSDISSKSPTRIIGATVGGRYTITVTTEDTYPQGLSIDKTCDVDVVLPEEQMLPDACTLGYKNTDGDFNYDESIQSRGWIPSAGTVAATSQRNYLVFQASAGDAGNILHPLACNYQKIRVEMRVRPPTDRDCGSDGSSCGVMKLQLLQRSTTDSKSSMLPGGIVTVTKTDRSPYVLVYAEGSGNQTEVYASNTTDVRWLRVGVAVDRTTRLMTVDVVPETVTGALEVGTSVDVPVSNVLEGQFSGVMVTGINGEYIDYVHVVNQSGAIVGLNSQELLAKRAAANKYLTFCGATGDPAANYSPKVRISYTNVGDYCRTISSLAEHQSAPGYCTFRDLQEVVAANSRCYLEAYSYCVNVTYLKTAAFSDTGLSAILHLNTDLKSVEMQSTGMDGATVCAGALGASVVAKKQAVPFMNVMWGLASQYWLMLVIIIVVLFIVGKLGGSRR